MLKRTSWWMIGGGALLLAIVLSMYHYHYRLINGPWVSESWSMNGVVSPTAYLGKMMGDTENFRADEAMMDTVSVATPPSSGTATENDGDRMVIRGGTLSMIVEDVSASVQKIKQYAEGHKGFVVTSNVSKFDVVPSGTITVRVPVDAFDEAFEAIKAFGEVKEEQTNGQDITEQYVDIESRLKNLHAAETQFTEIMKGAVKIEDVLAVQRELTSVRGQIELLEGQATYLRESADMSSITVFLSTDPRALPILEDSDKWKPFGVVKDAVRDLLDVLKTVGNSLIRIIVFIPLLGAISLIGWLVWRFVKKRMRK